jgi:hypothetical protein
MRLGRRRFARARNHEPIPKLDKTTSTLKAPTAFIFSTESRNLDKRFGRRLNFTNEV